MQIVFWLDWVMVFVLLAITGLMIRQMKRQSRDYANRCETVTGQYHQQLARWRRIEECAHAQDAYSDALERLHWALCDSAGEFVLKAPAAAASALDAARAYSLVCATRHHAAADDTPAASTS